MFCTLCHKAMVRAQVANKCKNQYKCQVQPFNTADTCKVHYYMYAYDLHLHDVMLWACKSFCKHGLQTANSS